jgi:hypothetical protein
VGAYVGNYTRGDNPMAMFLESNGYLDMLAQAGVGAIDSDFNDMAFSRITQVRRVIQTSIGDASPNNGFKIAQSTIATTNNFKITGGGGTADTAGRIFASGFPALLLSDVDFTGTYAAEMLKIAPMVTGVVPLVLTDAAANWNVNEHVGKTLVPNVTTPGTTFTVASNTATTITVTTGDLTTATAEYSFYQILPTTPGGARTDVVYLDVFLAEQNSTEDPNFVNPDLVPPQAGPFRLVLRQFVRIRENTSSCPAAFVDSNGIQHYTLLLATLTRTTSSSITSGMIADNRVLVSKALPAVEADAQTGITNAAAAQSTANTALSDATTALAGLTGLRVGFGGTGGLGSVTLPAGNTNMWGVYNYINLTIPNGATLTVPNYRALHVKCTGNLVVNGIVNGANFSPGGLGGATAAAAGAAGTQATAGTASGGGGGGGAGTTTGGAGAAGVNRIAAPILDGGGAGTAGSGGVFSGDVPATAGTAATAIGSSFAWLNDLQPPTAWSPGFLPGAPGGGGGAGSSSVFGAGGNGGPGGNVGIFEVVGSVTVGSTGSINFGGAAGVAGGSQSTSGEAGGGGGGGGGGGTLVILYGGTLTLTGTITVAGGAGGAAGSTGSFTAVPAAGAAGENGRLILAQVG